VNFTKMHVPSFSLALALAQSSAIIDLACSQHLQQLQGRESHLVSPISRARELACPSVYP
jgi:hypothetical protein